MKKDIYLEIAKKLGIRGTLQHRREAGKAWLFGWLAGAAKYKVAL
jgi:hypothetical protein